MADGIGIPPWLNINPLETAQFYTSGLQQGTNIGEARNRAQLAAAELAQRAQDRAAERQIAEMRAFNEAAQFASELALKREQNQEEARLAATRYEAAENIRRAIAGGTPPELAMFQNPAFFLPAPGALANVQLPFQPQVIDVDGTRVLRTSPQTVRRLPVAPPTGPIQAEAIVGPEGQVLGYGTRSPTGAVRPITPQEGKLSQTDAKNIQIWNQEANMLRRQLADMEANFTKEIAPESYKKAEDRLKELDGKIRKILGDEEAPTETKQEVPPQEKRKFQYVPGQGLVPVGGTTATNAPITLTNAPTAAAAAALQEPPAPSASILETIGGLPIPTLPPAVINQLTNAGNYLLSTPAGRMFTRE